MVEPPSVQAIDRSENYYHVRYADPDGFDEIRTPDWAAHASDSVSPGSEVRTGHRRGGDDWDIQSVLVPVENATNEDEARSQADEIVRKLES